MIFLAFSTVSVDDVIKKSGKMACIKAFRDAIKNNLLKLIETLKCSK